MARETAKNQKKDTRRNRLQGRFTIDGKTTEERARENRQGTDNPDGVRSDVRTREANTGSDNVGENAEKRRRRLYGQEPAGQSSRVVPEGKKPSSLIRARSRCEQLVKLKGEEEAAILLKKEGVWNVLAEDAGIDPDTKDPAEINAIIRHALPRSRTDS
jgi:hypothetical protein